MARGAEFQSAGAEFEILDGTPARAVPRGGCETAGVQAHAASFRRSRVLLGLGFVVLVLVGEWLGHAITWFLTGGATPGLALSGATHTYLGPVGVGLAILAVAASWSVWSGLRRLGDLVRSMRSSLDRTWRLDAGTGVDAIAAPAAPVREISWAQLWAGLAVVQLLVYLVQENVEARAAGFAAPGLHVLTAHHGSAVAIHAAIALLGAALAVEVADRWASTSRAVVQVIKLYRALTARRTDGVTPWIPRAVPAGSPVARFGRSFLPRPPPLTIGL